jgi:hypothetical protein
MWTILSRPSTMLEAEDWCSFLLNKYYLDIEDRVVLNKYHLTLLYKNKGACLTNPDASLSQTGGPIKMEAKGVSG